MSVRPGVWASRAMETPLSRRCGSRRVSPAWHTEQPRCERPHPRRVRHPAAPGRGSDRIGTGGSAELCMAAKLSQRRARRITTGCRLVWIAEFTVLRGSPTRSGMAIRLSRLRTHPYARSPDPIARGESNLLVIAHHPVDLGLASAAEGDLERRHVCGQEGHCSRLLEGRWGICADCTGRQPNLSAPAHRISEQVGTTPARKWGPAR